MSDVKSNSSNVSVQGQSPAATAAKQNALALLIQDNADLFKRRMYKVNAGRSKRLRKHYYYHHFDFNSGTGTNEAIGVDGTPITFIKTANTLNIPYWATFSDRSRRSLNELKQHPVVVAQEDYVSRKVCVTRPNNDYRYMDVLPLILRGRKDSPKYAIGTVVCDPNGIEVPWHKLAVLNKECPRIDFFIHFSGGANKRIRGTSNPKNRKRLREYLAQVDKKCWLIREPIGRYAWTVLIGRNIKKNEEYLADGFYLLNSPMGQQILRYLDATQIEGEPSMIAAPDTQLQLVKG